MFYGAGAAANATKIATEFGTTATALTSLPAGHVEVLLGSTVTEVPAGLTSSRTSTASTQPTGTQTSGGSAATASPTPSPLSTAGADNGAAGGAVTVGSNAKFGIPCVY